MPIVHSIPSWKEKDTKSSAKSGLLIIVTKSLSQYKYFFCKYIVLNVIIISMLEEYKKYISKSKPHHLPDNIIYVRGIQMCPQLGLINCIESRMNRTMMRNYHHSKRENSGGNNSLGEKH